MTGVTDDTTAIQAAVNTGDPVFVPKGTYLISMPSSVDAGNDKIIKLSSTTSKVLIGEGEETVFKLDLQNSFDGAFDAIGFDQKDATGGDFIIGNFKIDGDRANAKASQDNALLRVQTGTTITATEYTALLLPIWVVAATGSGCTIGCDRVDFDEITADDIGEHGVNIRNVSGDGRRIYVTGNRIQATNCDGQAVDYSGGSQTNGGPCTSNINLIYAKDCDFGVKIAGNHMGKIGVCELININLVTQNSNSAFRTNSSFDSFTIDLLHVQDSYNGSVVHAQNGELTINKLYSRNNNRAGNSNGDFTQSDTTSSLTINDYDGIGHADSSYCCRILEGRYTYLSISRAEDFDTSINYAGLSVETNGVCFIENTTLNHSPDTSVYLARFDTNSTGKIFINGFNAVGGNGNGPLAQGSGDVFIDNADVSGFTGNNLSDSNYVLKVGPSVKGFVLNSNTTDLEDISSRVNTDNKVEGRMFFNQTTNKPCYAAGSTAGSVWVDATGATAHTPA